MSLSHSQGLGGFGQGTHWTKARTGEKQLQAPGWPEDQEPWSVWERAVAAGKTEPATGW